MIKNLILSGCSSKLYIFIGSLQCLIINKKIQFKKLENILCTSGSSVIIFLLLLGYNIRDITNICCGIDTDILFYNNIYNQNIINNIIEQKGILNTQQIKNTLEIIIYNKIKKKSLTFRELYHLSGTTFILNAFCYDTNKIEYFSHKTHPNVNIINIILMAIAIPIIFPPIIYNNKTYCDAGIKKHIDFDYFFNNKTIYEIEILQNITLGLLITEKSKPYITDINNNFEQLNKYIFQILKVITHKDEYNEIVINNYNIINIKFDLHFSNLKIDNDIKYKLIIYGYKKTYDYIIKWQLRK